MSFLEWFCMCGCIYVTMEVFFDTTSHWSMFFAGGICGTIGRFLLHQDMSYIVYALLFGASIGIIEYIFGSIFNSEYTIWDYRNKKYNINGQVCFPFMLIWTIAMPIIIMWLDNLLL